MSRDFPTRIVLVLQPDVPADVASDLIHDVLVEFDTTVHKGLLADLDGFGRIVHYPETEQRNG